jgi:hypothetical protein
VYKVSFAGSTWPAFGPAGSPASLPIAPHPVCTVALQVSALSTDQPLCAPVVVTYTVWVAWFTSTSSGAAPTSTVGGGWAGQAARWAALQVALLSIETVVLSPWPLSKFGMYTVWLAGSAKMPIGCGPTGTVAGVCPQPEVSSALQVAPLNTETVLAPVSVT